MIYATHIGLGFMLSFLGSIPFGTINVAVAEAAINKNMKNAIWMALGASMMLFVYVFIALKFLRLIHGNPTIQKAIIWCSIPVFIGLGIYFLVKGKKALKANQAQLEKKSASGLIRGIFISSLNMLIIPFYVFMGTYMTDAGWLQLSNRFILIFALGVLIGSFSVFSAYAKLGDIIKHKSRKLSLMATRIVAFIFFALAITQFIRIMWGATN